MKQEAGKNTKKWLLPVIIAAIVLLLAAAVVVTDLIWGYIGIFGNQEEDPQAASGLHSPIYWNVDRQTYLDPQTGLSIREPGEDDLYHIRFAVDGEQVELVCSDKKLVNRIDMLDYMGLELDSSNNVVNIIAAADLCNIGADGFFVQRMEGDVLVANSSGALIGMTMEFTITDATGVYDVSPTAEVVGATVTPDIMDKVVVLQDKESGETTHVFVTERPIDAEVYWRVNPFYAYNDFWNSTDKTTTRVPDENGVYTILMAHNGEQVEVKCKDLEIVNKIDAADCNGAGIGLAFDEEGYAVQWTAPAKAVRGVEKANQYDITEFNGDYITFTRMLPGNEGDTYTCKLAPECRIYDLTECADFVGQEISADQLRLDDRVYLLCNADGDAVQIWITNRMVDSPLYWLHTRNFDMNTLQCTVKPDAAGYYHFKVCVDGRVLDVKTDDFDLLNRIQRPNTKAMGLEIEGNIVTRYYHYTRVTGGWATAYGYVTSVAGPILSTESSSGTTYNVVLAEDCQVYNCDFSANVVGEKSTLGIGDLVSCIRNNRGEVVAVFISTKKADAPVYFNASRQYDAKTEQTSRKPDADGYYVFNMVLPGKGVVKLKTQSKAIATQIDKAWAPYVGLWTNGDIITKVFSAAGCTGGSSMAQYCHVQNWEVEGAQFYALYRATGNGTSVKIDSDTRVYNVSGTYTKFRGEPTTLRLGDQITVLTNRKGIAVMIFVVGRDVQGSAYYRLKAYPKDADGYWSWDFLKDGKVVTLKSNDAQVQKDVSSRNIGMGLYVSGDTITRAFDVANLANYGSAKAANYDITAINGNQYTLVRTRPGASNTGDTITLTIPSYVKAYDVSGYTEYGAVKLQVGDRVVPYMDNDGKNVAIVFVTNRMVREEGAWSKCEHCGEEVFWMPFGTMNTVSGSGHYYLTNDLKVASPYAYGSGSLLGDDAWKIVIDLNGKTIASSTRAFNLLYDVELTIMDTSKEQTGTVIGGGDPGKGSGQVILVNYGADLTIYGGTFKAENVPEDRTNVSGGIIYVGNSLATLTINGVKDKYQLSDASLNIYGGTLVGTKALNGGVISLTAAEFNMTGGRIIPAASITGVGESVHLNSVKPATITGGVIEGGVYLASGQKGAVTISGETVIQKNETCSTGLAVASGVKVDFTGLTGNASIGISGSGVFTTEYASEEDAKAATKYFTADSLGQTIDVEGKALSTSILRCINGHSAADHAAETNTCEEPLEAWSIWFSKGSVPSSAGNYILSGDIVATARTIVYGADIVIDLNGKTITNHVKAEVYDNFSLYLVDDKDFKGGSTGLAGGVITIVDTSETQSGKIDFTMDEYKPLSTEIDAWKKDAKILKAVDDALAALDEELTAQAAAAAEEAIVAEAKAAAALKGEEDSEEYKAEYEAQYEALKAEKLENLTAEKKAALVEAKKAELLQAEIDKKIAANKSIRDNGKEGMLFYLRNGSLNIYGGTIDGSKINGTSETKGIININKTNANDADVNTVNVYGGTLIGGTSLKPDGTASSNIGVINGNGPNTVINVYGGTFRGTEAEVNGEDTAIKCNMGALIYTPGTLNIYDGEFIGRNTNLSSTVYAGTLNISGGKFYNGKSAAADNLYISSAVVATISGGEFESIKVDGNGLTITGDVVIGKLDIAEGKTVNFTNLGENASIGVIAKEIFTPAFETKEEAEAVAAKVKALGDTPVSVVANCLSIGIPEGMDNMVCAKGHTLADHETIECDLVCVEWTEWTDATKIPDKTGNYKLMTDIATNTQAFITTGQNVAIDLNGKNITTGYRAFMVHGGANVILTDLSSDKAEEQGTVKTTMTALNENYVGGNVIYAHTGSLKIYGGNYDASSITGTPTDAQNKPAYCGTIMKVLGTCDVDIYGGTFTGGTCWRGATIYNDGDLYIGGNAVINGGHATNMGGTIYNGNKVTVGGNAVINGGTSGSKSNSIIGGTIIITDNATLNRTEGNRVVMPLNVLTKNVTISGNATINGQIQIATTSSAYVSKIILADAPNFVVDGTNPAIYFTQQTDKQKDIIDATGLTGGTGLTVCLPNSGRTGLFGTGVAGVEEFLKSNDSNYVVTVNADGKLEMIAAPVAEEPQA